MFDVGLCAEFHCRRRQIISDAKDWMDVVGPVTMQGQDRTCELSRTGTRT